MAEEGCEHINNLILDRELEVDWPCGKGHELVVVELIVSRKSSYTECPICILQYFVDYFEDNTDLLGKEGMPILVSAKKLLESHR